MTEDEFQQLEPEQKQQIIQGFMEEKRAASMIAREMMGQTPDEGHAGVRIMSMALGMMLSILRNFTTGFSIETAIEESMRFIESCARSGLAGMPQDLTEEILATSVALKEAGADDEAIMSTARAMIDAHFEGAKQ